MKKTVESLKKANHEFRHELFDDADCREFLESNFPREVVYAYDALLPGSYKADLWRYCVLYKHGGVYLDVKFETVGNFKIETLLYDEQFCLDYKTSFPKHGIAVYNACMITLPGNKFLKQCIHEICLNVAFQYYGESNLEPTGPWLLGKFVTKDQCRLENTWHSISYRGSKIFETYSNYRTEQEKSYAKDGTPHYLIAWKKGEIYEPNACASLVGLMA
jgi:hypothetical protein